jgi:hypothetical protein
VVRSIVDYQVKIPVDKTASREGGEVPDPGNYVFREEWAGRMLGQMVEDHLRIDYKWFSPRFRQYLCRLDRLQQFLYLCLKGSIIRAPAEGVVADWLGWKTGSAILWLATMGSTDRQAQFVSGMNRYVLVGCDAHRGKPLPQPDLDAAEFVRLIEARKGEISQVFDLPDRMLDEVRLVLDLIKESGELIAM